MGSLDRTSVWIGPQSGSDLSLDRTSVWIGPEPSCETPQ